ncbi:PP2C family protein-serine/threonine phosphatase [Luedemannella helvata]|uniref:PP2C family protein-serine/threonine phosphatase n=1 Tax=Luedemannella helvata TaxID=349315 RepID=A0ABN2JXL5_9ACTN
MLDIERLQAALASAPAAGLVEALAGELVAQGAATGVRLLLVDYRLTTLLPLDGPGTDRPAATDRQSDGAAWRCFDGQAAVSDRDTVWVPVTARGERFGVLSLTPTAGWDERLLDLGRLLAHELAAARPTTDRYVIGSRSRRLTLAAEMQWEMLPGRACSGPQFALAGQLEPAYAVKGDTFDWAAGTDRLTLSVLDGMGEGVDAASLSLLATSALRNARRAGLGIADQAMMADSALYAQYGGARHVSLLLAEIDLRTGQLSMVDTGSPLLLLSRGDDLIILEPDRLEPIGMFDGSRYAAQAYQLHPGDRLVIVSDGVHLAELAGRRYGDADLRRLVRRSRPMAPLDVVRTLVGDLRVFVSGELDDDAAAVCLDWFGTAGPDVQ